MADDELMASSEAMSLAAEMFRAYRAMVALYRSTPGFDPVDATRTLTADEADAHAREVGDLERFRERVMLEAPGQVNWWELGRLAERDPDAAHAVWERVKATARDEMGSGHRAASVLEGYHQGEPIQRARFVVLRAALIEAWQPRNAVEATLIDTYAQCQAAFEFWLGAMMTRATNDAEVEKITLEQGKGWRPPRVGDAQAIEQAAAMADRFNRLAMRTLRALRDLRRYSPQVTIAQAGQVNIGGQQVNMASGA